MPQYSAKVMDHFAHPRNVGEMPDADGVGTVGNPVCGDIMKMYIKVRDGVIVDAKFQTFGCGAAIATSSISTEMIIGKSIDEAVQKSAINDYLLRTTGVGLPGMEAKDGAACDHHHHDMAHGDE
ncbi:MAG: NifU-like protein [bacterium ADurb.Bin429]|nr:MAG: NifU-like protein [bacterium ADurb.Bin429]